MHPNRKKIEAIDADEYITLEDEEKVEEVVAMDVEPQGRINQEDVNAASNGVSAAEPTVFDDEEDKQKKADLERALELQNQDDDKEENIDWSDVAEQVQESHLDNIRKYQSLKKKPVSIAQARKNMIIYLKNMAGYKMEHFRGMTYDKLRAAGVSCSESTQEIPSNDPKEMTKEDVHNMLEIILVSEFKVKALQVKYPIIDWEIHTEGSRTNWKIIRVGGIEKAYQSFEDMLKGFDRKDLVALWNLVKEKFSSAVPSEDKEKALWLYTDCGVHHVPSTRGHDIFMLTDKDYPLSDDVMILMLSRKLQVEEDNEMAKDLVMKIFMEANKPKSRSLDTSSNYSSVVVQVTQDHIFVERETSQYGHGNGSTQKSVKSTQGCVICGCDMTALDDPRRRHPMERIRMARDVSSLALYDMRQDLHVITKCPQHLQKLSGQRFDPLSCNSTITATTTSASSIIASRRFAPVHTRYLNSSDRTSRSKMEFVVYSGDQVVDLMPFGLHLPENWPAWMPGVVLAVVASFFTHKLGPLGKIKEELDKVEEVVDGVADRVEEIAEKVEEFVGDIADDLPEGSQLRQTLEKVEMVADTIGKDAKMVSDIVDKMDEMEAKLETILDKANEKKTIKKAEPQ
uniref:Uncharacterized protein n=1 Tax=Tanacetum cinerariifolium TaxID=118510 RepID=A0A6L2N153_TANCI|nr:hypothetical protein [Tanacetum cinerariifolium]